MTVNAEVTVAERRVPLAVRESGLQGFRDFTVVFAQIGETYEVRMLELGARYGEWIEVLGGLKPGTNYVTEQSVRLKADTEPSGARHDHCAPPHARTTPSCSNRASLAGPAPVTRHDVAAHL